MWMHSLRIHNAIGQMHWPSGDREVLRSKEPISEATLANKIFYLSFVFLAIVSNGKVYRSVATRAESFNLRYI